jgi:ubiquinone/menaquinone biosynthesis C-methylase UbiE
MPTESPIYDDIGRGYNKYRQADPRIIAKIIELLDIPTTSTIADIGAGTGNYSRELINTGFTIVAIEPSNEMIKQQPGSSKFRCIRSVAESIPLIYSSVDGIIAILSLHHFYDPRIAISEMNRICPSGPILIFTYDCRQIDKPWFADYFHEVWLEMFEVFPPIVEVISMIEGITGRRVDCYPFPLPSDLKDHFIFAGWQKPEIYLDEEVRKSNSGMALADPQVVMNGVSRLKVDLASGEWQRKYGDVYNHTEMDLGYRFLLVK